MYAANSYSKRRLSKSVYMYVTIYKVAESDKCDWIWSRHRPAEYSGWPPNIQGTFLTFPTTCEKRPELFDNIIASPIRPTYSTV